MQFGEFHRPVHSTSTDSATFDGCMMVCTATTWCESFQHEWTKYACTASPNNQLRMGSQGRCYASACVLLSAGKDGRRCDEDPAALVPTNPSPLAGQIYFVVAKVSN
jgi:hypothetical protein